MVQPFCKPEEEWPQAEVGELSEDNLEVKNDKPKYIHLANF